MTAKASCLSGYSSSVQNRIAAPWASSREAIAGIGTYVPVPGRRRLRRGSGPMETATAVEMNTVGLRPTSSGSFPPLFAKASATNAPAFAQFPQTRRRFQYHNLGNQDHDTNLDSGGKN